MRNKEWWIRLEDGIGDNCLTYWKVFGPGVWTENPNATKTFTHVIEKKAYDKAIAALKKIKNNSVPGGHDQNIAIEALKELGE